MARPVTTLTMLAVAGLLALPVGALGQDQAAEVPDISVTEPQAVSDGPVASAAGLSRAAPALWATVNICDTAENPDRMGVRASMTGNGGRGRMWMRFTAEYWSRSRRAWSPIPGSGSSPWVDAGSSRSARRQAGWTFSFVAPPEGVTYTMRVQVEFEWRTRAKLTGRRGSAKRAARARWKVVRTKTRATETGIRGVDGGDPAGTSKAMCVLY